MHVSTGHRATYVCQSAELQGHSLDPTTPRLQHRPAFGTTWVVTTLFDCGVLRLQKMDGNHKWQVCALNRYVNWYMMMVINCVDIRSLDTTALDYASCRGHISSYITPLHHEHITLSSHGILSYYDHLPTCFKTSQAYVKHPSSSPSQKNLAHSFSTGPSMVFPHGCFFFQQHQPVVPRRRFHHLVTTPRGSSQKPCVS